VSAADADAAAKSRKLKGDQPRFLAGPIIGGVTDNAARVWVKSDRRAAWQLEVTPQDHPNKALLIDGPPLTADTDFTGAVTLTGLHATTHYQLRFAIREPQAPPQPQPLAADTETNFRTLPAPGTRGHVRIVVGADIARELDQPIFAQIPPVAPDAVFLIGDQMYADAIGPDFASYANKYTASWRIDQLRTLMQRFPTFMIWDDHEIIDDYYAGKSDRYAPARLAYELYVQGHNPTPLREGHLYYTVQIGDIGFFVLDTRSERSNPRAPEGPAKSMLGPEQKADLFHWLACDKSRIKVIVSTVVMSDHVNQHDSWNAFPTEREELFSFIEHERIDDVVILSGDQHWSAVFAHERPHLRMYEFLPTPLSKTRAPASTDVAADILARDDDNFVFGVVDFDTRKSPASIAFTLCAFGKPCHPGAEPAPKTGLNLRGADENVPFTFRFTTADYGIR
jgi:alkaline phosphatase D